MSRWLTGGLLVVAIVGVGVGAVLLGGGDEASRTPPERAGQGSTRASEVRERPRRDRRPVRFTVSVSGDLLMHDPLLDRALSNGGGKEYDFAPMFAPIKRYVAGADLAICHVETPIGPGPPSTYPIFNAPTGLAASIHRSGWDACDTASNHSLDQGAAGIAATGAALDDRGVEHTGSFASRRAR